MSSPAEDFLYETGQGPFVSGCPLPTPAPPSPNFCTISFPLQALSFAQPGRSYLVKASWPTSLGVFTPAPLAAQIAPSVPTDWTLEASNSGINPSGDSQVALLVYVPSNAGAAYTALSISVTAKVFGLWSRPDNLLITPTWGVSAPIP